MPSSLGMVASARSDVVGGGGATLLFDETFPTGSTTPDWHFDYPDASVYDDHLSLNNAAGVMGYRSRPAGVVFWEFVIFTTNNHGGWWSSLMPTRGTNGNVTDADGATFLLNQASINTIGETTGAALIYSAPITSQWVAAGLHWLGGSSWNLYIDGVLAGPIEQLHAGDWSASPNMGIGAYNFEVIHLQRLRCWDGIPY
jgi:hypothetical protein